MSELRRPGARLAVTGCLAERHGEELAEALGEVDVVAGFGMDFTGVPPSRRGRAHRPGGPRQEWSGPGRRR